MTMPATHAHPLPRRRRTTPEASRPIEPEESAPEPAAIGWIGLFLPVVAIVIAVMFIGNYSLGAKVAMALVFIAVPTLLLLLRRAGDRTHAH